MVTSAFLCHDWFSQGFQLCKVDADKVTEAIKDFLPDDSVVLPAEPESTEDTAEEDGNANGM